MKVIALQGIRGGVGTTAIVAGLAQAAHEQGARVLAVDLCPDNQLGIHLGLPHDDPGGWSRLTQPAREWRGALHRREEGLDPGSFTNLRAHETGDEVVCRFSRGIK
ncbi:cellulose synthase operon protein YhjQ/BcsQ, partial [Aeromonas caviae]|uniref:cellulose synthase operon protein YhjQ/BcsQ n=1 Tax=Aeromonas caviae TaxID=648 RepID=UPI0013A56616